uniref:Reverse transcriptase Ty1/copia-type domain-containing protein n=1 Tax=Solanum lycopersicum TaxID=4081 RepID=A0A3Q7IXY1_SOLLC
MEVGGTQCTINSKNKRADLSQELEAFTVGIEIGEPTDATTKGTTLDEVEEEAHSKAQKRSIWDDFDIAKISNARYKLEYVAPLKVREKLVVEIDIEDIKTEIDFRSKVVDLSLSSKRFKPDLHLQPEIAAQSESEIFSRPTPLEPHRRSTRVSQTPKRYGFSSTLSTISIPTGYSQAPSLNVGVFLNQHKYTQDLISLTGLQDSSSVDTPLELNVKYRHEEADLLPNPTMFRQFVGSLNYLTITRHDISFAVQQVSQFMQAPRHLHLVAVRFMILYLLGTSTRGLFFPSGSPIRLNVFSDFEWAGCPNTRRSVTEAEYDPCLLLAPR